MRRNIGPAAAGPAATALSSRHVTIIQDAKRQKENGNSYILTDIYRLGQKSDTLLVFEFPRLLGAYNICNFFHSRLIFIK